MPPLRLALLPVSSSLPEPVLVSPPLTPKPPLPPTAPLMRVNPLPSTVTPPEPAVPMTVFGPITSVGLAPRAALLVIDRSLKRGNSRLPEATLARLMVSVVVTAESTVMPVTPDSVWPLLDVML
jgi:hypothetical protein